MSPNAALSELDGGPLSYPASIYSGLENSLSKHSSRPAVFALHQDSSHLSGIVGKSEHGANGSDGASQLAWTYKQLHDGSVRLAAALRAAGAKEGSTIVTFLPNGADWILIYLASIIAKLSLAALDIGAVQPARHVELQNFLKLLKPTTVIVSDKTAARAVDNAAMAISTDILLKYTSHWDRDVAIPQGWTDLDTATKNVKSTDMRVTIESARIDDHERIAVTLFTSGTSIGRPKGCPRTVISMLHNLDATQTSTPDKAIRRLMDTANFRAICTVCTLSTLSDGGALVVSGPSASAEGALRAIDQCSITEMILVPAFARAVANHPLYDVNKVGSVTTAVSGGDVVTKPLLNLMQRMFPHAKCFNAHGMSEGGNFFYWPFFDRGEPVYYGEIATFGTIHKGARVKVVDEDGNTVPRGTPGELHVDSHITIRTYLENVQPETFYTKDDVRWMRTGDTAIIDKDGYAFILGRSKDIIKRAGIPITPGAIETCLGAFTGADVIALGVEHKMLGAEPFAVLSSFGGKSEADLKARVLELMGKDYALGGAVTLQQLGFDSWPLNATGKVQKPLLKGCIAEALENKCVD